MTDVEEITYAEAQFNRAWLFGNSRRTIRLRLFPYKRLYINCTTKKLSSTSQKYSESGLVLALFEESGFPHRKTWINLIHPGF